MPSSSEREAFWRNLLTRRDTLRLTVGEACEQAGVSPASFYHWQRKLREAERRTTPNSAQATPLVPMRIVNDRVVELTLELPHSLRLRVPGDCDAATLGRILEAALAVAGHPFYRKLNELLAEAEFDRWIEGRCEPYYEAADQPGRASIPPGTFFRMLLVGYFEGIDSQRGIAWRGGDSLSLREFLNYAPQEPTPDHSTLSITRKRLPPEVFDEVFQFVLKLADEKRLLSGKTVGVDSTTL